MAEKKKTAAEEAPAEETKQEETNVPAEQKVDAEANVPSINIDDLGFSEEDLDDLSGVDHLDSTDMSVPYAKLYSKKQDGYDVGNFVMPDGEVIKGKEGEELKNFSILSIRKTRVYFPEQYKKGNTFICRSFDNEVAAPDGRFAGRACATCEFAQFPEEGGAPPCSMQYLLLCTSDNVKLFHIIISGIGVSEFKKKFTSTEMQKGLSYVRKALGMKKVRFLGGVNLNLRIEEKETDYGPFPYMHFYVNPEQPVVSGERMKNNREAMDMYKDFEEDSLKAAAAHAGDQENKADEGTDDPAEATDEEDVAAKENPNAEKEMF